MEKGGSKSNFFGFGKVNCIELNLNLSGTEWYRDYWSLFARFSLQRPCKLVHKFKLNKVFQN